MTHNQEQTLSALLQQFIQQLSAFQQSLAQEAELMRSFDPQALEDVVKQKQIYVQAIADLEVQLFALFPKENALQAIQTFLQNASVNNRTSLQQLWQTFLSKLAQCQQQNLSNGNVVQASLQQSQQMLDTILHKEKKTETYGSDGKLA
jgi:flagellar biosynthesis/type III secretory pathway chaperone